jgi:hypothetical protein
MRPAACLLVVGLQRGGGAVVVNVPGGMDGSRQTRSAKHQMGGWTAAQQIDCNHAGSPADICQPHLTLLLSMPMPKARVETTTCREGKETTFKPMGRHAAATAASSCLQSLGRRPGQQTRLEGTVQITKHRCPDTPKSGRA